MGERTVMQEALFYSFCIEDHVPQDHLLRSIDRFGLWPEKLVADAAYGSAPNLAWLVEDQAIELHIPVFDKSARSDDTFARSDFTYDHEDDSYICSGGNRLRPSNRNFKAPRPLANIDAYLVSRR